MPKQRNPFMRSQTIPFRSALQFNFAIQVFDQLSLTPSSNNLALAFEWRKEFHFHNVNQF
jgi:hypothetical protein